MIYGTIYSRASLASLLRVIELSRVFTECPGYKQGLYILEIVKFIAPLKLLFPFLFFFTWPLGSFTLFSTDGYSKPVGINANYCSFFFFCKAPHTFFFFFYQTHKFWLFQPPQRVTFV